MNYGRAVKILLGFREMSQQDLAKAMDVDEAFVSRLIAKNDTSPTMKTLEKVTTALDVPMFVFVLLASERADLPDFEPEQTRALGALFLELLVPKEKSLSAKNERASRP